MSKMQLSMTEVLLLIRRAIQNGNTDAALGLIDDLLPQVKVLDDPTICRCGRDASEATGDPLLDHKEHCEVHRIAALEKRVKDLAQNIMRLTSEIRRATPEGQITRRWVEDAAEQAHELLKERTP